MNTYYIMNKNLPMELINKILIMRPPHPITLLLKEYIKMYEYVYDKEYDTWYGSFGDTTLENIKNGFITFKDFTS